MKRLRFGFLSFLLIFAFSCDKNDEQEQLAAGNTVTETYWYKGQVYSFEFEKQADGGLLFLGDTTDERAILINNLFQQPSLAVLNLPEDEKDYLFDSEEEQQQFVLKHYMPETHKKANFAGPSWQWAMDDHLTINCYDNPWWDDRLFDLCSTTDALTPSWDETSGYYKFRNLAPSYNNRMESIKIYNYTNHYLELKLYDVANCELGNDGTVWTIVTKPSQVTTNGDSNADGYYTSAHEEVADGNFHLGDFGNKWRRNTWGGWFNRIKFRHCWDNAVQSIKLRLVTLNEKQ